MPPASDMSAASPLLASSCSSPLHESLQPSTSDLHFGKDSHLSNIVKLWAESKASEAQTTLIWVDLLSEKKETVDCHDYREKRMFRCVHGTYQYADDQRLSERRESVELERTTNRSQMTTEQTITYSKQVEHTEVVTLTWEVEAGLSLQIPGSMIGSINPSIMITRTECKAETKRNLKTVTKQLKMDVQPYHATTCSGEVLWVKRRHCFTVTLPMTGDVCIKFKDKVRFLQPWRLEKQGNRTQASLTRSTGFHRKQFVPIADLLKELQSKAQLPSNMRYDNQFRNLLLTGHYDAFILEYGTTLEEQTPLPLAVNALSNLTERVSNFKAERLIELRQKIADLQADAADQRRLFCAITGAAGCGKSELAKVYAFEHESSASTVSASLFRWLLDPDPITNQDKAVDYSNAWSKLLHHFHIQMTKAFETETAEQQHERLRDVLWRCIEAHSEYVIIFDNAYTEPDVRQYLPTSGRTTSLVKGLILITTQNPNFFYQRGANFSINAGLTPSDAVSLLTEMSHCTEDDGESAASLAEDLDPSPLAIRVAATYMSNLHMTSALFRELLKKGVSEQAMAVLGSTLSQQSTMDTRRTLTLEGTLRIAVQQLRDNHSELYEALNYCAVTANVNIPNKLLVHLLTKPNKDYINMPFLLKASCLSPVSHSLLTYRSAIDAYSIHRTTQSVIRGFSSTIGEIICKTAKALQILYPFDNGQASSCRQVESHLLAVYQHATEFGFVELLEERCRMLLLVGQIAFDSDRLSDALQRLELAEKQIIASSQPIILTSLHTDILHWLGRAQREISDVNSSFATRQRAVKLLEGRSAANDWRYVRAFNNLAFAMSERNSAGFPPLETMAMYNQAEIAYQQLRSPSPEADLEMAKSHVGIGDCLSELKEYAEATKRFHLAVTLYNQCLGPANERVAVPYTQLARIGMSEGEVIFNATRGMSHSDAVEYMNKAIEIWSSKWGICSSKVASGYYHRARLLYGGDEERNWKAALIDVDKSISIQETILGRSRIGTESDYELQGLILQRLGQYDEAGVAYNRALEIPQLDELKPSVFQRVQIRRQEVESGERMK